MTEHDFPTTISVGATPGDAGRRERRVACSVERLYAEEGQRYISS